MSYKIYFKLGTKRDEAERIIKARDAEAMIHHFQAISFVGTLTLTYATVETSKPYLIEADAGSVRGAEWIN